MTWSNVKRI